MKGYTILPNAVLLDKELDSNDKVLLGIIIMRIGKKKYCWPTNEQLGNQMNCSAKTIQRSVAKLTSKGYIFTKTTKTSGKSHRKIYVMAVDMDVHHSVDTEVHLNNKQLNRVAKSPVPPTAGAFSTSSVIQV